MKNFTLVFALGLVLLTSCNKNNSLEKTRMQPIDSIFVLNQLVDSASWEAILMGELQKPPMMAHAMTNRDDTYTNGYYIPKTQDAMTVTSAGSKTFMMLLLTIMLKMQ